MVSGVTHEINTPVGVAYTKSTFLSEETKVIKRGQGTGLGLNIVYNLVTQKLKGKIDCSSTYGHGVEFAIQIPYKRQT